MSEQRRPPSQREFVAASKAASKALLERTIKRKLERTRVEYDDGFIGALLDALKNCRPRDGDDWEVVETDVVQVPRWVFDATIVEFERLIEGVLAKDPSKHLDLASIREYRGRKKDHDRYFLVDCLLGDNDVEDLERLIERVLDDRRAAKKNSRSTEEPPPSATVYDDHSETEFFSQRD